MKTVRRTWTDMLTFTLAIGSAAFTQTLRASTIPITFEAPTYSTTVDNGSVGVPGSIYQQDGWDTFVGLGVGSIAVTSNSPIAGSQSLLVPGGSTTQTRAQASGLLTDGALGPITPASMSWLVRVDSLGTGGTGSTRAFESGITTNRATGATPFTIIFNRNLSLQYYNAGNVNFSGNPTYSVGTVYRVELTNLNDMSATYDATIYNNTSNAVVASVTGAPLQAPVGNAGVYFYVLQRQTGGGAAMVDNITASAIPEPSCVVIVCLGVCGGALLSRRRRS